MTHRKSIGIRALKNETSRIVNEVREGEAEYLVTKRGEPVAILRPLTASEAASESEEQRGERANRTMRMIRETAEEVGRLPKGESAASVVSKQRR